jgi:hypothetical protein
MMLRFRYSRRVDLKWGSLTRSLSGFFVYYESIKRKLNKRLILDCRCDVRLKVKDEGSTGLVLHTLGDVGTCNT